MLAIWVAADSGYRLPTSLASHPMDGPTSGEVEACGLLSRPDSLGSRSPLARSRPGCQCPGDGRGRGPGHVAIQPLPPLFAAQPCGQRPGSAACTPLLPAPSHFRRPTIYSRGTHHKSGKLHAAKVGQATQILTDPGPPWDHFTVDRSHASPRTSAKRTRKGPDPAPGKHAR